MKSYRNTSHADLLGCTTGDIRLVDAPIPSEGQVEVCLNNTWGRVCGGWAWEQLPYPANVACGQLGFSPTGMIILAVFIYIYNYSSCAECANQRSLYIPSGGTC